MKTRAIALAAILAATTACAGQPQPLTSKKARAIIAQVDAAAERCFAQRTESACNALDEKFVEAERMGYCYGPEHVPISERDWGLCSDPSFAPLAPTQNRYITTSEGTVTLGTEPCRDGTYQAIFIESRRNGTGAFGCWAASGDKVIITWTTLVGANGSALKSNFVKTYPMPR